ncbi:hypothetical protein F4803DRAFT_500298 [Xylaria telfairii]|nr:hypothetical protein F4803DRAFT_500298 [Xylaria telfairii]
MRQEFRLFSKTPSAREGSGETTSVTPLSVTGLYTRSLVHSLLLLLRYCCYYSEYSLTRLSIVKRLACWFAVSGAGVAAAAAAVRGACKSYLAATHQRSINNCHVEASWADTREQAMSGEREGQRCIMRLCARGATQHSKVAEGGSAGAAAVHLGLVGWPTTKGGRGSW